MKKTVMGVFFVVVLLLSMACGSEPDAKADEALDGGPTLNCAFYPQYNVSLLYVFHKRGYAGGLTGEFFDGNICNPIGGYRG